MVYTGTRRLTPSTSVTVFSQKTNERVLRHQLACRANVCHGGGSLLECLRPHLPGVIRVGPSLKPSPFHTLSLTVRELWLYLQQRVDAACRPRPSRLPYLHQPEQSMPYWRLLRFLTLAPLRRQEPPLQYVRLGPTTSPHAFKSQRLASTRHVYLHLLVHLPSLQEAPSEGIVLGVSTLVISRRLVQQMYRLKNFVSANARLLIATKGLVEKAALRLPPRFAHDCFLLITWTL